MKRLATLRQARSEAAQTLAEFAIILPLIIIIIFSLVDLARAMQSYVTIQEGARDGVRYAVTGRIDCASGPQTREDCIRKAVADRVASLNNAGSISATFRSWQYPTYANPATANNAGDQCDAIEVEVNYDYQPMTPIFGSIINNIPMRATERLVNEPFGSCS